MAITYFGTASTPADNGSDTNQAQTVTPPVSLLAGDLLVVCIDIRYTDAFSFGGDSIDFTTTGGQTWYKIDYANATTLASVWVYACRFNGTLAANPVIDNGFYSTFPMTCVMHVIRPSDTGKIMDIDVMPKNGTFTAGTTPFTKTITGITTLNPGAIVLAMWVSSDDNTWDSLTAGWTVAGSAQYRNLGGSDSSMTFAYQIFASAGATGNVSKNQATLGGDAGATIIMSFYEHDNTVPASSPPTVDIFTDFETSTDGTAITPTIMANSTHGASTGTWSEANTPESTSLISTTAQHDLNGKSVVCNGVTYDGSGTRSFKYDHSNGSVTGYHNLLLAASHAKIVQGFWMMEGMDYNTGFGWTGMGFSAVSGTDAYLVQGITANTATKHQWGIHTNVAATVTLTPIYLSRLTWYYRCMIWDVANSIAKGVVFDTSWNQVGFTVNIPLTTPGNVQNVQFGCVGGSQADEAGKISYIDSVITDWTSGTFPLAPGTAGGATIYVSSFIHPVLMPIINSVVSV